MTQKIVYFTHFYKILIERGLIVLFFILLIGTSFVRLGKGLKEVDLIKNFTFQKQKSLAVDPDFTHTPLYFIPNKGQVDKNVLFYARATGYTLWLTKEGLVFDSIRNDGYERDVSWLTFRDWNKDMQIIPVDITYHKINYFRNMNTSTWRLNISTAKAVLYKDIYKSIDLKVYGNQKQVEYDWIIKPGADPGDIAFTYRNVKSSYIDGRGNLVITTGFGNLVHKKPLSRQEINQPNETGNDEYIEQVEAKRTGSYPAILQTAVDVEFKRIAANTYGFRVGGYNRKYDLIIDPLVQIDYSTYLGGSEEDFAQDIAVDRYGNVYITGYTDSLNFPVKNACQANYGGGQTWDSESDVFITKLSPDGALLYSTYLGGDNLDEGKSIAVDLDGCTYITGATKSNNFPTGNPLQAAFAGERDLFITKLSADGSTILYSTYLGGADYDMGESIALDSKGCAYVTGTTDSPDFPTVNPLLAAYCGGFSDAFAVKISPSGSSLLYSTYIGGDGLDKAEGIAVDNCGCAFICGGTGSSDFPVKNPLQRRFAGGENFESCDAFVVKLSAVGDTFLYATYLGGGSNDSCEDIAVDEKGCAYLVGMTGSSDFPLKNPFQEAPLQCNSEVAFVTKLAAAGNKLVYSTYLGLAVESGWGIAVDRAGCAYVTGNTWSSDFPIKNACQEFLNGQCDAFVSKLSASGGNLDYSTYIGGSGFDQAQAVAVDAQGNVYITGYTGSANFPTKNPIRENGIQYNEAFVTRLSTAGKDYESGRKIIFSRLLQAAQAAVACPSDVMFFPE